MFGFFGAFGEAGEAGEADAAERYVPLRAVATRYYVLIGQTCTIQKLALRVTLSLL